ncbi:MAG: alpha-galactosidase [Enterococcus aquimarinus]|uniref:Alpha-galactosidase n=1 Tax=Enterococcus aquimarinus TaxID=328396 RepID=A0A9E3ZSH1_9ENTE|nr:alpha-galactosidase [Enterococcus aquimarinus]
MITFNKEQQVFHLCNNQISYLIEVEEHGYLAHLYFGKKINHYSGHYQYVRDMRSFGPYPEAADHDTFSLDTVMLEYPGYGFGDFREPAYNFKLKDGSRITDFRYDSFEIVQGKCTIEGLPHLYTNQATEAETLIITLKDDVAKLRLKLNYTIYQDYATVIRSTTLINDSAETVEINQLASQSLDFPNRSFELIHLNGAWGRERQLTREKIEIGTKVLDSKRGSSSHHQNPFVTLVEPTTTEFQGEAYGFCLVYSGNHQTVIEKDNYSQTRVVMGMNPFNFAWQLPAGESFHSPEVVNVYSNQGLNQMSKTYHDLFNHHLIRGEHQLKERPVLINNWEATYFDFDDAKIHGIVDEAQALGIEMFVLDDGWFGERKDDHRSLGDWYEFEGKLEQGLEGIAQYVHDKGMKFGLWFEPEMISKDSDLHRAHPDWVLSVPGRPRSLSRQQHVLDFSRADVRDHIYQQMTAILDRVPIDYIKWDMNRNMTEVYSLLLDPEMQGEVSHRYILGLYEFMEKLTQAYPHILFESCSGGGGRYDAGMLYYMPQTWTSDNTDPIARLKIQYSTSLVYPISTMGAHVSAIPNHQTGRETSLDIRGNVAMSGVLGYELDLTTLSEEEKALIVKQVDFYKEHRQLLQFGDFVRLKSPYEENEVAWMFVSKDKKEAIVFYFRVLVEASAPYVTLKLAHLDETLEYQIANHVISGDALMNIGMYIDPKLHGDYATQAFILKAK